MATKLKNMRLTSVDLVRNGANQEADICLFKSADPNEDPVQPTTEEKNIFKRFIHWFRENHAEADGEPVDPENVEKDYSTFDSLTASRENNEKLWQYTNALTESIQSIMRDQDLDKDQKYQLMAQSLDQFDEAMDKLIEALCNVNLAKSESEEEEDDLDWDDEDEETDWEEDGDDDDVQKFNHNHGSDGRFVSGGGGGGGAAAGAKYSQKDFQGSKAVADAANDLDKEMTSRGFSGIASRTNGDYGYAVVRTGDGDSVAIETDSSGKFSNYRWQGDSYKTEKYLMDKWEGKKVPDFADQVGKSADIDEIEEV